MGDVNLEIKLNNIDERVIKIEESGGGSGGDGYITSVSNDFNVVNKKLSLSNVVTTKLSKLNSDGTLDFSNVKSKPTTLSGYGITDAYTKSNTYSKTEVDAKKIDKPASATDGQVLTYNGTSNEWEARDSQGGSGITMELIGTSSARTSTQSDYETVTLSKGLSNYSKILFQIGAGQSDIWAFTEVPIELFNKTNSSSYIKFIPFAYEGQARKISDTQIGVRQMRASGADANGKVFIYGIK